MRMLQQVMRSGPRAAAPRALALRYPAASMHIGLTPASDATALRSQQQRLRTEGVQTQSLATPVFQIYGSNTDIGKTIISAGICRAANKTGRVSYIKPLQTGVLANAAPGDFQGDAAFVAKHALQDAGESRLTCSTLFSWETAVSPHLAATMENQPITDDQVVETLTQKLHEINADTENPHELVLVETAGGVCSPSASMRFQADVYRGLRLPVVLVGDGKLGGISTTISAVESLLIRGYDVAAICLIEQDDLDNKEALEPRTSELGIPIFTMAAVPPMPEPLDQWFTQHDATFARVNDALHAFHAKRLAALDHMNKRAEDVFWWPFTQHKKYGKLSLIDSAHGDEFCLFNAETNTLEPSFDACASWWTQGIGHGNSKMATAMAYTAARYGHVMFPENAHEPALKLSERLLETVGKHWASRVYFSDDGSTAVEVALKMAFRKFVTDHALNYDDYTSTSVASAAPKKKLVTLAQANCYHGDTLGVMNIAEPSVYNEKQTPWYRPEAVFLKTPSLSSRDGQYTITLDPEITGAVGETTTGESFQDVTQAFDASRNGSALADTYRKYVAKTIDDCQDQAKASGQDVLVGSVLIEPVLIGAGGMVLVDPLFQRVVVQECRARKIPVIFDEVFSGWWRLGVESGRDLLDVQPDIGCYAKLLTGGVVPLAVTLAREEIFDTFYADGKGEALLHGHSFTAHPVGCAAALTALDMYDIFNANTPSSKQQSAGAATTPVRAYWDGEQIMAVSRLPQVSRAFAMGTVACIELQSADAGYASSASKELIQSLRSSGIYARALGNVVYLMCSPLTTQTACSQYLATVERHIAQLP